MSNKEKTFEEKYGTKNKKNFVETVTAIKCLSEGAGKIRDGFVVPKRGREVEFHKIVSDTKKSFGVE